MRKLVWNVTLADQAKRVVSTCTFQQDTLNGTIGQMVYAGGPAELNAAKANETLFEWYDRDISSNPIDEEGFMELKSASQILWADTWAIGCASHWCPNQIRLSNNITGVLTACNYFPSGNFRDQPVFKVGVPCLECSENFYYCDNKMCTREHDTFESHFSEIDPSIKQTLSPLMQNPLYD